METFKMKTHSTPADIIMTDDIPPNKEDEDDIAFENRCGYFKWRPNFLQRFRSIYLFLITACLVCILQTALSAGYMSSQITTLERRFSLDSYMLGIIQSFFDVGFILSVIFVGFFGGQGKIPTWIGFGMLIMCLGAFSFSLPQFISSNYIPSGGIIDSTICKTFYSNSTVQNCASENKANWVIKLIFIVGQILIGSGSSPILSLAPTYIDDHVTPTLAPPLIALLHASSALGPVIGFGLGAVMLQHPDNGVVIAGSKPGDHDWIGAWWGGYVCLGIGAAFVAIFLFMFPRRVRKINKKLRIRSLTKKSNNQTEALEMKDGPSPSIEPLMAADNSKLCIPNGMGNLTKESSQQASELSVQISNEIDASKYGKNIKDIPHAIWSLLSNKIYVVVSLAICCEMFLVNGFAAFLPKYIENEYKVSNITSSLIAGGLIVPAGALGIVAGGLIMHRFQIGRRRAVLLSAVGVLLVLVCLTLFFISGCNNPLFAGINTPIHYNNNTSMKISNPCNNQKCFNKCDPNQFSPVCDVQSGVTFFSGCHAGCENYVLDSANKNSIRPKSFFNCSCTALSANSSGSTVLQAGECPLKCNSLITFVLFLTLALFLTGITQNPLVMVTIRSVQKHERSFALGFQFVILRVLAYIPSPIIYGSVIDAACVHWKKSCSERGDCLVTDLKLLNYYIIGLSFAVKCGAAFFYILLYFIIPKHVHAGSDIDPTINNITVVPGGSNGDVVVSMSNQNSPSLS